MLRVGIIGLGTIAYIHQLGIEHSGLGELVAVSDLKLSARKDYEDYTFYEDFEEMLKEERLDVVHICLPHNLHVPIAKKCLEYGVHVFLEKPLSLTYKEGQELAEVVSKTEKKLGVCFQNRYNRTTKTLVDLLKNDSQGKVEKIKAVKGLVTWFRPESYYKAEPWRGNLACAGGGTIINQSIHTLDLMGLFAGEVKACKGKLMNLLEYDIEVEDTAVARYEFENDATGLYFATNAYEKNSSVELEVITQRKRYMIKDYKLYEFSHNEEDGKLITSDEVFEGTKAYYGLGHKLAIEHFYQSVVDGTDDYITVEEALNSAMMIDLLRKSTETNEKIEVREIDRID